jgi:hypothetical protein
MPPESLLLLLRFIFSCSLIVRNSRPDPRVWALVHLYRHHRRCYNRPHRRRRRRHCPSIHRFPKLYALDL